MNALFSLADKARVASVATSLLEVSPDWNFFGSKGTAGKLTESGIPATDIATLVGDPSPGHLVVTLSQLHFGLLCDQNNPEHMSWLAEHGLPYIDFVWASLYDLQGAIDGDKDEAGVTAATDMGGVALLRSGAKGRRLVSPSLEITDIVLYWLQQGRPQEKGFRTWLASVAEDHCRRYCELSANYLDGVATAEGTPSFCTPLSAIRKAEQAADIWRRS